MLSSVPRFTRDGSAIPELPEVETVRRDLEPWLSGRTILKAALLEASPGPKYAGLERAAGQHIVAVNRRGKFLLLPLSLGDELIIHLGMTGIISAEPFTEHTRVKLTLDAGVRPELHFQDVRRFGRFLVVRAGEYKTLPTLAAMGPEPLGDAFTGKTLFDALRRSGAPVKTYLLSQKPVAGVGNIYADEALWQARVHPLTPANRVSSAKAGHLAAAIRDVLTKSLEAKGTTLRDYRTVNGEVGGYLAFLNVYGHPEAPCPRCGTSICKSVVGGRGTHHCPTCQKTYQKTRQKRR